MAKKEDSQKVTVDEVEYSLNELSENAKSQILNIQFVDNQIQQFKNELAVADTARIGYTNALKKELSKLPSADS